MDYSTVNAIAFECYDRTANGDRVLAATFPTARELARHAFSKTGYFELYLVDGEGFKYVIDRKALEHLAGLRTVVQASSLLLPDMVDAQTLIGDRLSSIRQTVDGYFLVVVADGCNHIRLRDEGKRILCHFPLN